MNKRKLIAVAVLLLISAIAFLVSYDYASCGKVVTSALLGCFFRNAAVTVFRVAPLAAAFVIVFRTLPRGS